jgi:hypothetical protein
MLVARKSGDLSISTRIVNSIAWYNTDASRNGTRFGLSVGCIVVDLQWTCDLRLRRIRGVFVSCALGAGAGAVIVEAIVL